MSVDWTQLPPELVERISKNFTVYSDYLRFQAVCRVWQSSIPKTPSHLPPQLPWLMLSRAQSQPQSLRAFFNFSNDKFHLLSLPEASHGKRHCGSSHGWLVILDESPNILLLNPLSRAKVSLPPLSTFPNVIAFNYSDIGREYALVLLSTGDRYTRNLRQMRDSFIKKIVLSSSPEKEPGFLALAIPNQMGDLAYCRNGDQNWSLIEGTQSYCEDAIYYKGLFYAVDKHGAITVVDVSGTSPRVSIIETPRQCGGDLQYLVGSRDELLLVSRYLNLEVDFDPSRHYLIYRTTRFEVFSLDWRESKWLRVRNLGDQAMFIGQNSSVSVSASEFPGCMGNCIYYTDDYSETNYDGAFGEHDLGIYKLSDGTIEPLPCYSRNSIHQLRWPSPIWVTPNPC